MEKEVGLAAISSISVVAGFFVAFLLTRLESWRADARSAVAAVRAQKLASFADRDEALRAELHCWEVHDDGPLASSWFIDVVVAVSIVATVAIANRSQPLAEYAMLLSAPAVALLVLLVVAELLFLGQGYWTLRHAPLATFKKHP